MKTKLLFLSLLFICAASNAQPSWRAKLIIYFEDSAARLQNINTGNPPETAIC